MGFLLLKSCFMALAKTSAVEVLIIKGMRSISISRYQTTSPMFFKEFRKRYEKKASSRVADDSFRIG